MLRNSVRLFTVAGIEVGVHASWLIVFALLTWSLAVGYFPDAVPRLGTTEAWVLAAVAAILFFASVLLHELAHSFMAKARGLPVHSITLFIFGGVSNLGAEAKKPSVEFLVAVVGPLTSFAVAGVCYVIALAVPDERARALFGHLAVVNALVGAFNLIPGFPLDGGRVLRSIAWSITNSLRRGTEIAVGAGQLIGGLFILGGILLIFDGRVFNGIWIAAIGWFLQNAASASLQQVILETRLRGVPVRNVLRLDPTSAPPGISVQELIDGYLLPGNRRAVPVTDNGRLVGMVTLSDVSGVPAEERARVPVAEVMGGRDGLLTVTPDNTLAQAVEKFGERDLEQLPVLDDGRLVGVVTRADVMRQLQLREALNVGS